MVIMRSPRKREYPRNRYQEFESLTLLVSDMTIWFDLKSLIKILRVGSIPLYPILVAR